VKTNKHDAADAAAICEAVTRPAMRFVPIKTVEQQAILSVHRARAGFVKTRTATANEIRGLLAEFGIIIPQGIHVIGRRIPEILADGENALPITFKQLLQTLSDHLKALDQQIEVLEQDIQCWHRNAAASVRLAKIPGIGPLTASALVATVGDARNFSNGRQLAAWLGLVPRQHSSGGKPTLLGISKRGDSYLRTLMIHGARAVLRVATNKTDCTSTWLKGVIARRHVNVAAVALANKNARIVWALLAHEREFQSDRTLAFAGE
ncbi:IS110 family transposase, partial [Chitinimonas sp. PSY-7]|uniref:IS110 family transposase n=1 Tax=Chitinimonas sp. PSY-7 TaxID=3459088 RepID=UPI0040403EFB